MTKREIDIFVTAVKIQKILDSLEPESGVPHWTQTGEDGIVLLDKNFKCDLKTHDPIPIEEFKGYDAARLLKKYLEENISKWPKKREKIAGKINTCLDCYYCWQKDYGYSNWTTEGTDIICIQDEHPSGEFDRFYGSDWRVYYAVSCKLFQEGDGVQTSVEEGLEDALEEGDPRIEMGKDISRIEMGKDI